MTISSSQSIISSQFHYKIVPNNFTGTIYFNYFDGILICGWEYLNGIIVNKIKFGNQSSFAEAPGQNNCHTITIGWFLTTCNWDGNGIFVGCDDPILLFTQDFTRCSNGGGGGIGDNGSVEIGNVSVDNVTINISQQCILNAINKLTSNKLKNYIAQLYNQTFVGNGIHQNLIINQVNSTVNNYPAQSHPLFGSTNTWEIQVNDGYEHVFTEEVWGSIILHELVHGFIYS